MPEQKISVKISGTPVRKGGFIPIVNINEAFFEISDSYPSIMSRDACVYTVSVRREMTVYKLIFNRMRHHGDGSEARLVIGLSIPAGLMLPDGADAAGVLHTLLEAFIGSFAVALPDGTFEYRFGRLDTGVLENICNSIALIPADSHRVVMQDDAPRGAIEVSAEEVGPTLTGLDRDEFADISELIVAEHINTSVGGIAVIMKAESKMPEISGVEEYPAEDEVVSNVSFISSPDVNVATVVAPIGQPNDGDYSSPADNGDNSSHAIDGDNSSRGHGRWTALIAGVVLGAIMAYVALRVFDGRTDVSQVETQVSDTVVVAASHDTIPPAKVETIFVEKKVVETVRIRPTGKSSPARATAPIREVREEETPAKSEESTPAPIYKYDPEAERSL